ncbi:hypothetical protein [Psychrobacter sp. 72-O-c]|uniref:hypothetical protein n=1 Tax=Psychrobacter sp. 72-O-c TaxID=2774125 RepID=UPI00191A1DEA|nr:hypothetical protein [Psychrobacter sp. 72-O-c]
MTIENSTHTIPTTLAEPNVDSATINQIMEGNPDLSYEFVSQLLFAQAEVDAGKVEPYEF